MFTSTIIKIDRFQSKEGKPCAVAWFSNEKGLPCKAFISADSLLKEGDKAIVTVEPDFRCNARIEIRKQ